MPESSLLNYILRADHLRYWLLLACPAISGKQGTGNLIDHLMGRSIGMSSVTQSVLRVMYDELT